MNFGKCNIRKINTQLDMQRDFISKKIFVRALTGAYIEIFNK